MNRDWKGVCRKCRFVWFIAKASPSPWRKSGARLSADVLVGNLPHDTWYSLNKWVVFFHEGQSTFFLPGHVNDCSFLLWPLLNLEPDRDPQLGNSVDVFKAAVSQTQTSNSTGSLHPAAVCSLFIKPWQLLLLLAAHSCPQSWRD